MPIVLAYILYYILVYSCFCKSLIVQAGALNSQYFFWMQLALLALYQWMDLNGHLTVDRR